VTAATKILVLGPGAFVIGEGGDVDAATVRAARRLGERGHDIAIVTSNPSAKCSDGSAAARTYLEPLDRRALAAVISRERPAFLYPLAGGRRALEIAKAVTDDGLLAAAGTKLAGAVVFSADGGADARAELGSEWVALDVVVAADASRVITVCAIESLERAGVDPGDAVAVVPPHTLAAVDLAAAETAATALARTSGHGVFTVSLAIRRAAADVRILEVSSGTTRATALASSISDWDLAAIDADVAFGGSLPEGRPTIEGTVARWPRFAFETFPDAETALGPRRKSLGESIGEGATFASALRSAARGADDGLVSARSVRRATSVDGRRVLVLGAGPARIDAGPELATSLVDCLATCRARGEDPILVDASLDALAHAKGLARTRIAPVTIEHVLEACRAEHTSRVIVQLGGDTALRLASDLHANGISVLGTSADTLSTILAARYDSSLAALDDATGFDVEAVADGTHVVVCGVAEHLEPAFVHGGDAAAIVPPTIARPDVVVAIEELVRNVGRELGVVGFLAVRVIVVDGKPHVVGVEPRAGRTTAFVARATGFPIAEVATKVLLGSTLAELGVSERAIPRHVAVRERVFPFARLGVDPALGAAMRSTGEVFGIDETAARAYDKALRAIGLEVRAPIRESSRDVNAVSHSAVARGVLLDLTERDRSAGVELARRLRNARFELLVCGGTRATLTAARIPFRDLGDGDVTSGATEIREGKVALAIVTAKTPEEIARTRAFRSASLAARIPCFTTIALARLGCAALEEDGAASVRTLADWYASAT